MFRNEMSESDKVYYFGKKHEEHIANGVVRWQFIEDKLLSDIDLASHSSLRKPVTASLRYAMSSSLKAVICVL
jgi:hypothetical protein